MTGLILSTALVAACAGEGSGVLDQFPPEATPEPGAAELEGNFDGTLYQPLYAFSDRSLDENGNTIANIVLTDDAEMCEDWDDQAIKFGAEYISILAWTVASGDPAAPVETGEYEINDNGVDLRARATYYRLSTSECAADDVVDLESGQVVLDLIQASIYGGEIEGKTPGNETIAGDFHALACGGLEYWVNGEGVFCE